MYLFIFSLCYSRKAHRKYDSKSPFLVEQYVMMEFGPDGPYVGEAADIDCLEEY